ncbi:hypothetical protein BpHYR1_049788 [Brachionus plicatilis]|uniref:Uncharacterized protein n=1 Tax=Brachionus plicatilis TaxID=10195 RepID=A0A3M7P7G7_BRAPC|nr:hypothetical protein BpHYR1_049788 [Brachionus plicatilis]
MFMVPTRFRTDFFHRFYQIKNYVKNSKNELSKFRILDTFAILLLDAKLDSNSSQYLIKQQGYEFIRDIKPPADEDPHFINKQMFD